MPKSQKIRVACQSLLLVYGATHTVANFADGKPSTNALSYQANEACYCTDHTVQNVSAAKMFPTPIGGQNIAQICGRIGKGPGLKLSMGTYNHPAYSDAQCGQTAETATADGPVCTGLSAPGTETCHGAGPAWDLSSAYAEKLPAPSSAQNLTAQTSADTDTADSAFANQTPAPSKETGPRLATIVKETKVVKAQVSNKPQPKPTIRTAQIVADVQEPLQQQQTPPIVANRWIEKEITGADDVVTATQPYFTETVLQEPALGAAMNNASATSLAADINSNIIQSEPMPTAIPSGESALSNLGLEDGVFSIAADPISVDNLGHGGLTENAISMLPTAITTSTGDEQEFLNAAEAEAELHKPAIKIINLDGSVNVYTRDQIARLGGNLEPILGAAAPAAPLETGSDVEVEQTSAVQAEIEAPQELVQSASTAKAVVLPPTTTAIQTPRTMFPGKRNYRYIDAAPVSYDYGGTGIKLEASTSSHNRMTYFGRAAISDEYYEGLLGLGFYFSPFDRGNTDFILDVGVEYGSFDLDITNFDSTGAYVAGYVRSKPFSRFEIQGGASYSSFFEGDATAFAAGILQLSTRLNAISKIEVGDNDNVSLGLRYYY